MRFDWKKYTLEFKTPSGTSRGVLKTKDSWFIIGSDRSMQMSCLGECSIIEGLSPDPKDQIELKLDHVCAWLNGEKGEPDLRHFPSIIFAIEMLRQDIAARGSKIFSQNTFTEGDQGILTNGLIWMGAPSFMKEQVTAKVKAGFDCIKLKIGAMDFKEELALLKWIRKEYDKELELRVDANGAFAVDEAFEKLKWLSDFELHSIEQPIKAGQWNEMAELCQTAPLPIALDEELISNGHQKAYLLDQILPQYIILKPSLVGGMAECDRWIELAEEKNIGWWMTSALESNVGLSAIAQYAFEKNVSMPQGLGTGGLYTNNFDSPLYIQGQFLFMHPNAKWNLNALES